MGGRKWHWLAAGTAAMAVAGAVLVNDTTPSVTLKAQPFAAVDYRPDNGGMVVANPTIDATTVIKTTPPPAPPPPPKPVDPVTPPTPSTETPNQPPHVTISLTVPDLPVYYPNCDVARAIGAAPIHRDEPGYREELDGDDDGIACEKRY